MGIESSTVKGQQSLFMTEEQRAECRQRVAEIVYVTEEERELRVETDYRRTITEAMDVALRNVRDSIKQRKIRADVISATEAERQRRVAGNTMHSVLEHLVRHVGRHTAQKNAEAERVERVTTDFRRIVPERLEQLMADTREHVRRVGASKTVIKASSQEKSRRIEVDARHHVHMELTRVAAQKEAREACAAEQADRMEGPYVLRPRSLDDAMARVHTALVRLVGSRAALQDMDQERDRRVVSWRKHAVQEHVVRRVNQDRAWRLAAEEQAERTKAWSQVPLPRNVRTAKENVEEEAMRFIAARTVSAAAEGERLRRVTNARKNNVHADIVRLANAARAKVEALTEQRLRMATDYRRIVPEMVEAWMASCRLELVRAHGTAWAMEAMDREQVRRVAEDCMSDVMLEIERYGAQRTALSAQDTERLRRMASDRVLRPQCVDEAMASVNTAIARHWNVRHVLRVAEEERTRRVAGETKRLVLDALVSQVRRQKAHGDAEVAREERSQLLEHLNAAAHQQHRVLMASLLAVH